MAITTKAGLLAAVSGSQIVYADRGSVTGSANAWNTNITSAIGPGITGAGVLAGTSTAAGVVPTSATQGFPYIRPIAPGNTAYLYSVDYNGCSLSGRVMLFDLLFKAGAYNFNDSVALAGQPSYAARIPNGDYKGTELWFECVTAFTGVPTLTITYTNQDGVAGQSTTYTLPSTPALLRTVQIPLAAGDTGVQKVESVTCTVATAGTFNVLVTRKLWQNRITDTDAVASRFINGPDKTGLPVVYDTCALFSMYDSEAGAGISLSLGLRIIEG